MSRVLVKIMIGPRPFTSPKNGLTSGSSIGKSPRHCSIATLSPGTSSHGSVGSMWAIRGLLNVRSSAGESRISRGPAMPREHSSCAADKVIVAPAESPIRLTLLAPTSVTNSSARSAITGTTWAADPKGTNG